MKDYSVTDRVNSRAYAYFLAQSYPNSVVAQNEDGKWEVRVPKG